MGRFGLESHGGKPWFEKSAQHGPSGCYQCPPEHPTHVGAHGQAGAPQRGTQLRWCTGARTRAAQLEQAPNSLHCRSHPADLLQSLEEHMQRHFCAVPFEKYCGLAPKAAAMSHLWLLFGESCTQVICLVLSCTTAHAVLPQHLGPAEHQWELGITRISPFLCTGGV